jgi:hypothetical protein
VQVAAHVESAWFQRLKLKFDQVRSSFAFNCNFRHYSAVPVSGVEVMIEISGDDFSGSLEGKVVLEHGERVHPAAFYMPFN